ncbi:hypothetical protein WJX72_004486 [[Myrmecia] bisecta]|uniref:Uncharacterized protein n=1 Tax=[Myrmecia] bisecta TaxID=41462 RepID=A0AAW1PKF3_9CHLO
MAKASASSRKSKRLTEAVESLQYAAIRAIKEGNEATARSTLEEKAKVTEALQKSRNRAEANQALAARLERLIGLKQTELIALLSASGKLQPVDSRTRIIVPDGHPDASIDMGDDGNSDIREPGQRQLEAGRSNPVHEVSDGTSSGGSRSTHLHDAASSGQWGSSDDASASQSRRGWSGNESAPDAGGGRDSQTSSRSADLERRERWRSERDIDAAFLEMERQSLEALLSATPSARGPEPSTAAPSAGDAATSSPASSAGPQQQLLPQWWLSGEQLLDKRAEQTDSESGYKAGVRASALLARIVNGRVRGRDPKAADLSMLAVLSMRAHAAGVRVKAPSDLTSNVKQSIFRNALSCANAALQRGETLLQVDDWEEVPEAARENEARAQALANQHAAVYLVALATVLHLDSQQAAVMASAAVAATTRQVLLEAVVGVRQAGEERVAEGQRSMARLRTVLDRVAPPAGLSDSG